jgi:hypothetical protein
MKRNLLPRLPDVRGAIFVIVERVLNGPSDISSSGDQFRLSLAVSVCV